MLSVADVTLKRMSGVVEAGISSAANAQNDGGFAERVAENQRRVFQIAYGVLANAADAEEISQEVFLRAYRKFWMLRDGARFQYWVNRIAFRLALNRQRDRGRQLARDTAWHADAPEPVLDGPRRAHDSLFLERVREEIDRLPEKLRVVILLCSVEGMDINQVAATLSIPAGTVRSRLHLARKHLLGAFNP
jgi:RNA polymerase sigma-70 factor, ECF subfamily